MLNILLSFGHQIYNNCIRTEKGYCAIQWKESSTATPDPFQVGVIASAIFANGPGACAPAPACTCASAYINIPALSPDGVQKIPIPPGAAQAFQSQVCGSNFGIEGMVTIASPLVCKFLIHIY